MTESIWETLDSTLMVDSPHLRVRREHVRLPNGHEISDWYTVEAPDTAIVFALTPSQEVVLIKIYRHSLRRWVYELPMGAVSSSSTVLNTGIAELAEETGWRAASIEAIGKVEFEPARSARFAHFLYTDNITPGTRKSIEAAEDDIKVELVSIPRLVEMLQNGNIMGMPTVLAIYQILTDKQLWPR